MVKILNVVLSAFLYLLGPTNGQFLEIFLSNKIFMTGPASAAHENPPFAPLY